MREMQPGQIDMEPKCVVARPGAQVEETVGEDGEVE